MRCLYRRLYYSAALGVLLLVGAVGAQAMSLEQRQALDLSRYTVTAPDAGYFDVTARRALLAHTDNDLLLAQIDRLAHAQSCRQLLEQPVLVEGLRLPSFYPRPEAWGHASRPYLGFEDAVSGLAGAYVATGDGYYADCLVRYLDRWARHGGLLNFYYALYEPQAWYATESMIFAAAMAYAVVRPAVADRPAARRRIDAWLNRLAHRHVAIPGRAGGSCCNNHFYRRALYASMVGVLSEDDALFQFGVSAIHSALHEMTAAGGLPRELARGRRALHYQNYALLYLIPNLQIIARQGYDLFALRIDGKSIHDAVALAVAGLRQPERFHALAGGDVPEEQYLGFIGDAQYFAWMELYLARFDSPAVADFVRDYRPLYNRGAGGYATLYFMPPEAQRRATARRPVPRATSLLDIEPYGDP